ncbi:hypothetical protein B0H17DRAFT_1296019 [Mycena rosella]|uniref:Uncharacterized protein n=1 Tax=Mycena rosella TaxID=1033263 RepID=A0AAD7DDS5_MYCRO|nr:hypothetical protein B0H17DRAFT_1296019 [Mycena rosella]
MSKRHASAFAPGVTVQPATFLCSSRTMTCHLCRPRPPHSKNGNPLHASVKKPCRPLQYSFQPLRSPLPSDLTDSDKLTPLHSDASPGLDLSSPFISNDLGSGDASFLAMLDDLHPVHPLYFSMHNMQCLEEEDGDDSDPSRRPSAPTTSTNSTATRRRTLHMHAMNMHRPCATSTHCTMRTLDAEADTDNNAEVDELASSQPPTPAHSISQIAPGPRRRCATRSMAPEESPKQVDGGWEATPPEFHPPTRLRTTLITSPHTNPGSQQAGQQRQREAQEAGIQLAPPTAAPTAFSPPGKGEQEKVQGAQGEDTEDVPLAMSCKHPSPAGQDEQPPRHLKMEASRATLVRWNKLAQPIPVKFDEDLSLLSPPPAVPRAHPANSRKPANGGSTVAAGSLCPPVS